MGRLFLVELEGNLYRCRFCDSPLALVHHVLSRRFNCQRGKAYLFSNVVNVTLGPDEERMMLTGMHIVEDVYCCCCGQILGWKYVEAHEKGEKYKEGKYVLERWRITQEAGDETGMESQSGSSDRESA